MMLLCTACDLSFKNCGDWNLHLISEVHQKIAKVAFERGSIDMKERTIVCWQFSQIISSSSIIEHFGSFGLVHDICIYRSLLDHGIKAFAVLMDSQAVVSSYLTQLDSQKRMHKMGIGKSMKMSVMTCSQWEMAIGICKEELLRARHNELSQSWENLTLQDQLLKFVDATTLTQEQMDIRKHFLKDLQDIIQKEFPSADLFPFGSFVTGLCGPEADIDIFVDVGESKISGDGSQALDESIIMKRVVKRLWKETINTTTQISEKKRRFQTVLPIYSARVPIIQLVDGQSSLHADLSFRSNLSTFNTKLILFYINYDCRMKPLMLLIRYWARYHHLVGSDKIKNYALVLMVIVFLNQQFILPSVHYLQNLPGVTPSIIDGCNVAFCENVDYVRSVVFQSEFSQLSPPTVASATCEEILKLAKDFFIMYSNLNFEEFMICPLLGVLCDKLTFKEEKRLPSEISWFSIRNLQINKIMIVQDPFKLEINVTSNVRLEVLQKFQSFCQLTITAIENLLDSKSNKENNSSLMNIFINTGPPPRRRKGKKSKNSLCIVSNMVKIINNCA